MDRGSADDLELRVAWQQHVAITLREFDAVLARHREPHRRYHTVRHVRWVVHHARHLALDHPHVDADGEPIDLGAVVAAAFYHDAIYDPRASGNEAASARLAAGVLLDHGWADDRVMTVVSMIEATAGHSDASDASTAVLLAADLGVLAADPAGYRAYVNGVRVEYAHVAADDWSTGRSAVLHSFIDRSHIYPARLGLTEWEARARANIATELAALQTTS